LLIGIIPQADAISLRHLDLQQLSQQASFIFHGKVVANRVEIDSQSGQIVTYTDFQVIEAVKIPPPLSLAPSTYTIKQLGGHLPGTQITQHVPGVPRFEAEKEYLLFLPPVSKTGFCSPIGLYQGQFEIQQIKGEKVVSNGRRFSTTIASPANTIAAARTRQQSLVSLPAAVNPGKPDQMYLNDFINTIRTLSTTP